MRVSVTCCVMLCEAVNRPNDNAFTISCAPDRCPSLS